MIHRHEEQTSYVVFRAPLRSTVDSTVVTPIPEATAAIIACRRSLSHFTISTVITKYGGRRNAGIPTSREPPRRSLDEATALTTVSKIPSTSSRLVAPRDVIAEVSRHDHGHHHDVTRRSSRRTTAHHGPPNSSTIIATAIITRTEVTTIVMHGEATTITMHHPDVITADHRPLTTQSYAVAVFF